MQRASRKESIVRAFAAAELYDDHAAVQRRVAQALAERISQLPLPRDPRICEIGCGTGFLSAALAERIHNGDWLVSDICPAMLDRARSRLQHTRFRFAVIDGERPGTLAAEAPFDLICSSLAAQWFVDLEAALQRLFQHVRPGGHLALTTLVRGTFAEWSGSHADLNLKHGTPDYPTQNTLRAIRLDGVAGTVTSETLVESHQDGLQFLESLKAIGARTPSPTHAPLNAVQLRAVLKQFERRGNKASYCVATCIFTKRQQLSVQFAG